SLNRADVDLPDPHIWKNRWVELLGEHGRWWDDNRHPNLVKIVDVHISGGTVILSTDQSDFTLSDEEATALKLRPVLTYHTQPNSPLPGPRMGDQPEPGEPNADNIFLAYLDVWQRQITVLDDPSIRDVALGGADIAQRSQTLWQVKVAPISIGIGGAAHT